MTAPLELTKDPLGSHLALEVLDSALDPLLTDGDLERFALNGFAGIRQGSGGMADARERRKSFRRDLCRPGSQTGTELKERIC